MQVYSSRRGRGSCLIPPKICDYAPSAGSGDGPKIVGQKAPCGRYRSGRRKAPRLSGASHPPICKRGTPANAVVRGLVPPSAITPQPSQRADPQTGVITNHDQPPTVAHVDREDRPGAPASTPSASPSSSPQS